MPFQSVSFALSGLVRGAPVLLCVSCFRSGLQESRWIKLLITVSFAFEAACVWPMSRTIGASPVNTHNADFKFQLRLLHSKGWSIRMREYFACIAAQRESSELRIRTT